MPTLVEPGAADLGQGVVREKFRLREVARLRSLYDRELHSLRDRPEQDKGSASETVPHRRKAETPAM